MMGPISQALLDSIPEKYLDIQYGSYEVQKLDIYLPVREEGKKIPVIFHTHGGAFMFGEKDDSAVEPMLGGISRGYAVVSVQYRMSKQAPFPAQLYDVKLALRWLKAHADEYSLDASRICAWGPSSGGWLVSMIGLTPDNPAFEDKEAGYGEQSTRVKCVIDWCGPTAGFLNMDEAFKKTHIGEPNHDDPHSPESIFLNQPITSCPDLVRLASPIAYVNKDMPDFLIVHGKADPVVPIEQSIALMNKIKLIAGEDKVETYFPEGKGHHGEPWYHSKEVADICFDFLSRKL